MLDQQASHAQADLPFFFLRRQMPAYLEHVRVSPKLGLDFFQLRASLRTIAQFQPTLHCSHMKRIGRLERFHGQSVKRGRLAAAPAILECRLSPASAEPRVRTR